MQISLMEDLLTNLYLPLPLPLAITITITITITTLTTLLITTILKLKSKPLKRPPSPPHSLPLIGHLPYFLTQPTPPHHTFAKLSQTYGPIFRLQLGRVNTVIISSAHLAQLVLKAHDHVFCNRPKLLGPKVINFGCYGIAFAPYGPYWRQARKICVLELLSPRRVDSFHRIRIDEVNALVKNLLTRSGSEVSLTGQLFQLSNNVLCRIAFGMRYGERDEKDVKAGKKDLAEVLTETQALLAGFCVGDFFPGWEWLNVVTGLKRRLEQCANEIRKVCDEIIARHVSNEESGGDEDFVDVLLKFQKREDLKLELTDDNMKAIVMAMFVAGTDTTAATLEWIMTELIRHPEVMAKAQEEVHGVVANAGGVTISHLNSMNYMKCVIKETLRLHPPVPLLVPRESMEDCTLDGFFIPKKSRVMINSYAIGRDPEAWPNPLKFDPSRFFNAESIEVKDQDFRLLPFGGGRRSCPGYAFGLATVELALANLLYHFNWALPGNVCADDIDLTEIFGAATRKKNPLLLVPTVSHA